MKCALNLPSSGGSLRFATSTDKISGDSTATNHYIAFTTSNSEAMRIVSSGFVGIGTGTPAGRLHLVGISNSTGGITLADTLGIVHGQIYPSGNSSLAVNMPINGSFQILGSGSTALAVDGLALVAQIKNGLMVGQIAQPSATLHVKGNALITSWTGINFGNNNVTPTAPLEVFGNVSATQFIGAFVGDGSGLTNVGGASADRIVSNTTSMLAMGTTGFVSLTQAGTNTGWFDPTLGLVTIGVSSTGPISGTNGYFSNTIKSGLDATIGGNITLGSHLLMTTGRVITWANGATGGTTAIGGTSTAGTQSLTFTVSSTEAMRIVSSGFVGIGKTSPTIQLDVSGSIRASSQMNANYFIAGNYQTSTGGFNGGDGNRVNILFGSQASGGAWPLLLNSGGTFSGGYVAFKVDGTEGLRITSATGVVNVGIGTTAPSTALEVSGTVSATRFVGDGSGLTNVGGASADRIVSNTTSMLAMGTTGFVSLTQAGTNTGWFDPSRGLVTIGVSTTGVVSSTGLYNVGNIFSTGNIQASGFVGGMFYPANTYGMQWPGGNDKILGDTTNHYIAFTTSNSEAMRIVSSGFVGIGTVSPTATLQISGTLKINGVAAALSAGTDANGGWIGTTTNHTFGVQSAGAYVMRFYSNLSAYLGPSAGSLAPSSTLYLNGTQITTSSAAINMTRLAVTPLEVSGTISATGLLINGVAITGSGGGSSFQIQDGTGQSAVTTQANGIVSITTGGVSGTAYFNTAGGLIASGVSTTGPISGTNGYFSGNVGMGIAPNPSYRLYVSGNSQITGQLTASNFLASNGNGLQWGGADTLKGDGVNHYISINPSSTEAMRIVSSGFVGIGTSTPAYALQVSGIAAGGSAIMGTNSVNAGYIGTNGNNAFDILPAGGQALRAYSNHSVAIGGVGGTFPPTSTLLVGGTSIATSWTAINTNNGATAPLEVSGTISATGLLINGVAITGSGGGSSFQIQDGTGQSAVTAQANGIVSITTGGVSGTAYFNATGGLVASGISTTGPISGTNGYFSGSVGIGALPNSGYSLSTNNSIRTGGVFQSTNAGSAASPAFAFTTAGWGMFLPGGANGGLAFTTSSTEAMRIVSTGYVGIDTTQPSSTLHVMGTNASAGGLTIGSTSNNTNRLAIYPVGSYSAAIQMLGVGSLSVLGFSGSTVANFDSSVGYASIPLRLGVGFLAGTNGPSQTLQVSGTAVITSWTGINFSSPANVTPTAPLEVSGTISATAAVIGGIGTGNLNASGLMGVGTSSPNSATRLDVSGSILSRPVNNGSATAIDWSQGNAQYTSASCGALTFTNMVDGGVYTLAIKGTTSGTCSFSQSGLTYRMPSNHGATTNGTMTLYSFLRMGSDVFVTWTPGY